MKGKVIAVNTAEQRGIPKKNVVEGYLREGWGLEGDAHAGKWHRQVSFLSSESIDEARRQGLEVTFGDFAENIATIGVDWKTIPIGTRVRLGDTVVVEITQIGIPSSSTAAERVTREALIRARKR